VKPAIVFDVNETLLNLSPIRAWFTERFNDTPNAKTWFAELLRLSFVSAATNRYVPFTALAISALDTTARMAESEVTPEDSDTIAGLFTSLPAHSDAKPGLELLQGAGFHLAALTNSPKSTVETQLRAAGLAECFDSVMSVEMVNRFKPHASVYLAAAGRLGVDIADLVMVAAHDWDIAGAMAVGCTGVFVARPGMRYSTAFAEPTIIATDIGDAATQIIGNASRSLGVATQLHE